MSMSTNPSDMLTELQAVGEEGMSELEWCFVQLLGHDTNNRSDMEWRVLTDLWRKHYGDSPSKEQTR